MPFLWYLWYSPLAVQTVCSGSATPSGPNKEGKTVNLISCTALILHHSRITYTTMESNCCIVLARLGIRATPSTYSRMNVLPRSAIVIIIHAAACTLIMLLCWLLCWQVLDRQLCHQQQLMLKLAIRPSQTIHLKRQAKMRHVQLPF